MDRRRRERRGGEEGRGEGRVVAGRRMERRGKDRRRNVVETGEEMRAVRMCVEESREEGGGVWWGWGERRGGLGGVDLCETD